MIREHHFDHSKFIVRSGTHVDLGAISTTDGDDLSTKEQRKQAIQADVKRLARAQRVLWASEQYAMLIIFQGLDAAGKDGAIRHVMSGVNPQGCAVHSFKAPSEEELQHHFLWRPVRYQPGRGRIAIFNRSYYEEVLIVRVHPEFLEPQRLRIRDDDSDIWCGRFEDINTFEHTLTRNGTQVLKFFLHLSKDEQRRRFLDRIDRPEKHWKFNEADVRERRHWDEYQRVYADMLSNTSTEHAPWYIIPADEKWYARAIIADVISSRIESLDLTMPTVSPTAKKALQRARQELLAED